MKKLSVIILFLAIMPAITSEKKHLITIHPYTLLASAIPGQAKQPMLDYEYGYSQNLALTVGAGYYYANTNQPMDKPENRFKTKMDIYGANLGAKYYSSELFKGMYYALKLGGSMVNEMDFEYREKGGAFEEDEVETTGGDGFIISLVPYIGHQWKWSNNLCLGIDFGLGYRYYSFDIEGIGPGIMKAIFALTTGPVLIDANLTLGYNF